MDYSFGLKLVIFCSPDPITFKTMKSSSIIIAVSLLAALITCQAPQPLEKLKILCGTFTDTESKGVYLLTFDPNTGEIANEGLVYEAPNPTFLKNWGEVCGEWSKRYGKLVSGWWFDGYKMEMKDAYESLTKEPHNIDTWVAAVLSGNPEAELAFNAGAHPILSLCTNGRLCPHQTFTSGENHDFHQKTKKGKGKLLTPKNFPAPKGVVWHLLLPVAKGWGAGEESRFELETLKDRIDLINSEGGAVTLDVPISSDGMIPVGVLRTLGKLGKESKQLKDGVRSF